MNIRNTLLPAAIAAVLAGYAGADDARRPSGHAAAVYSSPLGMAAAPDGRTLYVAENATDSVAVVDVGEGTVIRRWQTGRAPRDVLAIEGGIVVGGAHGTTLFNADGRPTGAFAEAGDGRITALCAAPDGRIAAVDGWNNEVLLFDRDGKLLRRIAVDPAPQQVVFTPDGERLLVTCDGPGMSTRTVCAVSTAGGEVVRYELPGSASLRGIAVSPDGRFALVAHVRPRAGLPATQVAQGWVFTNTLSYLPLGAAEDDARARSAVALPLDEPGRFYATPFDVVLTPDGKKAYVSHAGADVVSVIDVAALEEMALERLEAGPEQLGRGEDLRMTRRYVKKRIGVGANPRRIVLSRDATRIVVANHLGDSLSVIDTVSDALVRTIALREGDGGPLTDVRRGEVLFNSARLAFAGQFACASCHPDGGSDGLNWDLPADGIGNFHNSKSLIGIAGTEPYGWLGNSKDFPARFGSTLRTLFQFQPEDDELAAIGAYLSQLEGDSPPREDPESAEARRGEEVFELAGCTECHRSPRYTDRRLHNVGTAVTGDRTDSFDTPSLVGVSETPPYLHHGRARTLEEVLTRYNPQGLHGGAAELTDEERADLVAFLRSLGPAAAAGNRDVEASGSASAIEGTIRYRGAVPRNPVPDTAGIRDPLLEINRKNGGLRYVMVYLDPRPASGAAIAAAHNESPKGDDEPAVIDQQDYRFVPHLIAVRSGQRVRFTNSDGGNHNIRGAALDPRNQFNVFTGPGGASERRFYAERRNRPVRVTCDIHAWMGAWIYVFDHPYYAVTDADGRFRIEGIAPGSYVVRLIQPDVGISLQLDVTVETGRAARVDREFSPTDTKSR